MASSHPIVLFFDIGQTLGTARLSTSPISLTGLDIYPYVTAILQWLSSDQVDAELGIISNTGDDNGAHVDQILAQSGILDFFHPHLRIYSKDVGLRKDSPLIFQLAAGRAAAVAGALPGDCIYVGEDRLDRDFAAQAGMRVAPHPSLLFDLLRGRTFSYLRIATDRPYTETALPALLEQRALLPLYVSKDERALYAIATESDALAVDAAGFDVRVLGAENAPLTHELYLLQDYQAERDASTLTAQQDEHIVLDTSGDGLFVALPASSSIDNFHFGESHGHTLLLMPSHGRLQLPSTMQVRAASSSMAEAVAPFAATADLRSAEVAAIITSAHLQLDVERYSGQSSGAPHLGRNRHSRSPQMPNVVQALVDEFTQIGGGLLQVRLEPFTHQGQTHFNILAELPGQGQGLVIVSAHLDSTAQLSFHNSPQPYNPLVHDAPGADDDGSGIAGVLAIARVCCQLFATTPPQRTIRFALFNTEEQGMIGSIVHAKNQSLTGAAVDAVLQMDMIGYNVQAPNSFEVHIGATPLEEAASAHLAVLLHMITDHYIQQQLVTLELPQLYSNDPVAGGVASVRPDGATGRSDHSSFHAHGWPACVVSEDFFPGPRGTSAEGNPNYHRTTDITVNYTYAADIARVIASATLVLAQTTTGGALALAPEGVGEAGLVAQMGQLETTPALHGVVRYHDGSPVAAASVQLFAHGRQGQWPLTSALTDANGRYALWLNNGTPERDLETRYYLTLRNGAGQLLQSTQETHFALDAADHEHFLTLPEEIAAPAGAAFMRQHAIGLPAHQQIHTAAAVAQNEALMATVTPEDVLNLARAYVLPQESLLLAEAQPLFSTLFPELSPASVNQTLCGTEYVAALYTLIRQQQLPNERDLLIELHNILSMRSFGFATAVFESPNFRVEYQTTGPAAVDPDNSALDLINPGSNPPTVLATLPAGGPPTYIKLVVFWLERALAFYTAPPFGMRNPAALTKIPVFINSGGFGSADPNTMSFAINNRLPNDLVCAVAVHELFHLVQFHYPGFGPWRGAMLEGGATFAEDTVADLMNRYLDEAGSNFNGEGLLFRPNQSLLEPVARYKTSLFWRYLAEQRSLLVDEPTIGVDTYRRLLEKCSLGTYSTNDIKSAIREMPWQIDFYEFSYLDVQRRSLNNSETSFGNFALACYLKELGENAPDRRFDFLEDEENIHIDDVVALVNPGVPLTDKMIAVTLANSANLLPNNSRTFSGSVQTLANLYHELTIDAAVTNVRVEFQAAAGLTSRIFQIVLIDEDMNVRDIYRTDNASYVKHFANLRDGKRLAKIALIVSGGISGGVFSITATAVSPAPDVMITRWNSEVKKEYHFDSRNWAWTWLSPDLYFEVDENTQDVQVKVQLHNKGNQDVHAIAVDLAYQPIIGGLTENGWLPILDANGVAQQIQASLAASASGTFEVPWQPPAGMDMTSFTLRARLQVAGDPNTDNKEAISSLGVANPAPNGFADLSIWRRNRARSTQSTEMHVVPRMSADMTIPLLDVNAQAFALLAPDALHRDVVRVQRRPETAALAFANGHAASANPLEERPNPESFYPTLATALPITWQEVPLVTVFHEIDGLPDGGVTIRLA